MDSKITKQRINGFLSYEWILVVVFIVIACLVWEIFYGIASVKPTVGQEFKYYYDANIDSDNAKSFHNLLLNKNTFSFDVLENNYETISPDYEVLNVRLEVGEGDIMITQARKEKDVNAVRAREIIKVFILPLLIILSIPRSTIGKSTAFAKPWGTLYFPPSEWATACT